MGYFFLVGQFNAYGVLVIRVVTITIQDIGILRTRIDDILTVFLR